jgi:hypothetical protein
MNNNALLAHSRFVALFLSHLRHEIAKSTTKLSKLIYALISDVKGHTMKMLLFDLSIDFFYKFLSSLDYSNSLVNNSPKCNTRTKRPIEIKPRYP